MIRTLRWDPQTNRQTAGQEEQLDRWRGDDASTIWVDLSDVPTDNESRLLVDYFGLHPLAIEDAQRDRHPAKIEAFDTHTFILLKGLDAETRDLDFGTIQTS